MTVRAPAGLSHVLHHLGFLLAMTHHVFGHLAAHHVGKMPAEFGVGIGVCVVVCVLCHCSVSRGRINRINRRDLALLRLIGLGLSCGSGRRHRR